MYIEKERYSQILQQIPISCVDLVIEKEGKILLLLRKNVPAKGEWWFPGGRIYLGENMTDAVKRKAREELGIEIENPRFTGAYETVFRKGERDMEYDIHTINLTFYIKVNKDVEIKIDEQSEDYMWADIDEEDLNPYVKKVIKEATRKYAS